MKLDVIIGFAEYLLPRELERELAIELAHRVSPSGRLLDSRIGPGDSVYHWYLCARDPKSLAQLHEYAHDACADDETAVLLLPLVEHAAPLRYRQPLCEEVTVECVAEVISDLQGAFGAENVATKTVALSHNGQDVLTELARLSGAKHHTEITKQAQLAIAPDDEAFVGARQALRRNYSRNVLALADSSLGEERVFDSAGRIDFVAEYLEENELLVRDSLPPQSVAAAIAPDGEIYKLLCTPLPHRPAAMLESPSTDDD